MFPSSPSPSTDNQDSSAAKAPLPPVGKTSPGGSPTSRGSFLKSIVSGIAPVEKGIQVVNQGLDMIRSAGMVDPMILSQFKVMVNALLPLALQQAIVPGGANQGLPPPVMGQAGVTPAGGGLQGPPPSGPPPAGPGPAGPGGPGPAVQ